MTFYDIFEVGLIPTLIMGESREISVALLAVLCLLGGIAAYFDGVDSTLIRVIMVILAVLGFGGLIIYIICAIIMPLDTDVDNVQKKDDRW